MISFKSYITIDEAATAGLAAKAKKSGISIGTLRKVYNRGMAAWNSGHRPGTTPQQWGMARVNSYITKGKGTYHGADKDLHEDLDEAANAAQQAAIAIAMKKAGKKPKDMKEDLELDEGDTSKLPRVAKDKDSGLPKKYVAGLSSSTAKARAAHWDKMDKKSDSDPSAYEPAPGDATAKTKPSKHTKKYHDMFGEEMDEELYEACWSGYKQVGVKKKGDRMVPDCVPEELTPDEQFDLIEDFVEEIAEKNNIDSEVIWEDINEVEDEELLEYAIDKKGYKSSEGGLTQKGVDAYNRKTGGNMKTAVTTKPSKLKPGSKAAKRRKSFCARMGGMKKRLTSAKTANDPDSRINKALRKWNC